VETRSFVCVSIDALHLAGIFGYKKEYGLALRDFDVSWTDLVRFQTSADPMSDSEKIGML
jgi:hypothetical protein